jgi:DNA-binding CsgD family transcriptional regulator
VVINHPGMAQPEASDSFFPTWTESSPPPDDALETVGLSAACARATDEAGAAIAQQLNGPVTALLLYLGEIKQYSQQLAQAAGNRVYLQQVVENALRQTEHVSAVIKQMAGAHEEPAEEPARVAGSEKRAGRGRDGGRMPLAMLALDPGRRPLTRREREVLNLISEGYSNKKGAMRMKISPRTFESHRAEAMRKLGARNTADLVRLALLHPAI